jgi:hypothetical protein
MIEQRIAVEVDRDGVVQAHSPSDNSHSPEGKVSLAGLDADVIKLFERWLTLRDREWREGEIRVFGSLLHRYLFADPVWFFIESHIEAPGTDRTRLELIFPPEPPYSRLAAIPWEYLYRPARFTDSGSFLAADRRIVLSRYIRLRRGEPRLAPLENPRMLTVISQPDDRRLGEVVYDDVLDAIREWARRRGVSLSELHNPTAAHLHEAVVPADGNGPDLVHFMGHGEFDPDLGAGSLALADPDGAADWVADQDVAQIFSRGGAAPRAVVLHSCEGGRADFSASFAGLAPQLALSGVQCVVAMQYAVTNETATAFSISLYEHLATGCDLDVAVQEARWQIGSLSASRDPRLLGIPVVYMQNRSGLFSGTPPERGEDA